MADTKQQEEAQAKSEAEKPKANDKPAVKEVTLLTVAPLSPYNKDGVFTVSAKEAELLLAARNDKDEPYVIVYDPNNPDHVKKLEAQRGKPVDAE